MLLADVDEHRALINGVTTLAEGDIASYAASILDETPERVAAQLRPATTAVIDRYGDVAAVSGALFYETNRPRPGYTAPLATPSFGEAITAEIGWALVPLFNPAFPPTDTVSRLRGLVQKYVANADRETIVNAARRDPIKAETYRYARVGACAFCALMSAQSVRGGHWHDNCKCVEIPSWDEAPAPASELRSRHAEAAEGARQWLSAAKRAHPDYAGMSNRRFLRKHPEYAINNKNLTRVMREMYGFSH